MVKRGKIKYVDTWEIKGGVLRTAAVLVESISKTVLAKNVEWRRFERAAQ